MNRIGHEECHRRAQRMVAQARDEGLTEPAAWAPLYPFFLGVLLLALCCVVTRLPWPAGLLCLLAGGTILMDLAFIGHDAGHGCHARSSRLQDLVGLFCFALCFIPYYGFRAMHRAHHRHTGFDEDPTGDSPKFKHLIGVTSYLMLVLVPAGFLLLVVLPNWLGGFGYQPRVYTSRERPAIRWNILFVVVFQAGLWALLTSLGGPGAYPAYLASFGVGLWLVTMVLSLTHYGVESYTSCELCNTRSVRTGPLLDVLLAGGGYHVEHHLMPNVPWYNLPRLHQIVGQH